MRVLLMDLRMFLSESWPAVLAVLLAIATAGAFIADLASQIKYVLCGAFAISFAGAYAYADWRAPEGEGSDGSSDSFGDGGSCE